MPHIHITLVGGQPAPVYNSIVATNPDKVIFIYSRESYDTMQKVISEIRIEYEEKILDPVDIVQIDKTARGLADAYANDNVTVNISSGTKPWSYFFASAFDKHPHAAIVFMDQNNVLWDFTHKTSRDDFNFDMLTLFRLYGNSLEGNYVHFSEYNDKDRQTAKKIEDARWFSRKEFNSLLASPG